MEESTSWIKQLAPEMWAILEERMRILQAIHDFQPIGRRALSNQVGLTERTLRTEMEALRSQGLLYSSQKGMELTDEGKSLLQKIQAFQERKNKKEEKIKRLEKLLGIQKCEIVPGDSDSDQEAKDALGQVAADILGTSLPLGENTIGVMGGTTMANTAEHFSRRLSNKRHLTFVPARGGMSEAMDIQANAICEEMARRTGGDHRVLYIPELVSSRLQSLLLKEPEIRQTLDLLKKANCVLFSISNAQRMAERRRTKPETLQMLKEKNAVGEAFGEYFDLSGRVVYRVPHIGMQPAQLAAVPMIIAAAGGKSKAKAIAAYCKIASNNLILVTDEGAADQILSENK